MSTGFSIRTAIFSIVLAMALWALVSLRGNYEVPIAVPLEVILAPNRSIEAEIPREIRYQIRASGWHLVNLLYFNADAKCILDLSSQKSMSVTISTQDLQQAFRASVPASVLEVFSHEFGIQLGVVGEKRVPLVSKVSVQAGQGFIQVGAVQLQPDSVNVRGNVKVLETIHEWQTMKLPFSSCTESQSGTIRVSDSLATILSVEPSSVRYAFEIQRSAEITLEDIPVQINGAAATSSHRVQPSTVSISIRAGVEQIEQLKAEQIQVQVDYAQLSHDTTGIIVPHIIVPTHVKVLSVRPATLLHFNTQDRSSFVRPKE